jgi:hypothetical protein
MDRGVVLGRRLNDFPIKVMLHCAFDAHRKHIPDFRCAFRDHETVDFRRVAVSPADQNVVFRISPFHQHAENLVL